MPKSIDVLPERLNKHGKLHVPTVPLYRYNTAFDNEINTRGNDALIAALRHMMILREFETLLSALRSKGEYANVKCAYRGPAHLSAGQEAVAVGMAMALDNQDHIFGSHRSHGEFLAKGLAAIGQLSDNALGTIMMQHADGTVLKTLEQHGHADGDALAEDFLLFGFLTEILMRACGFNGGMGGSMHAFFPPFGCYPNNAIVGGSAGIASGAALHKRISGEGIAVSLTGDGSTGCGAIWEALNFASMGQIESLWQEREGRGLPVLFAFTNNFYAMGGQTIGETMSWDRLSRIGLGVNELAAHAQTVDGTNPLAVAESVTSSKAILLKGQGPCLLDLECYRYSGHSTSDANAYRSREEIKAWTQHDPIDRFSNQLCEHGVLDTASVEQFKLDTAEQLKNILMLAANPETAPIVNVPADPTLIGRHMFSNSSVDVASHKTDEGIATEFDLSQCARVRQNGKKSRQAKDAEGKVLSPMRAITLRDGLFESILYHMLRDDSLIAYGEECREWGGAFGVYRGLSDLFPAYRLFNSPISEATIVSSAAGYAMEGGRALVELMYADFIGRAGDEIFNQLSKWQAMSAGQLSLPVVLRCSVGSKYGAQHSQDWSSLVTHIPGLKVLYPATPYDAKGLMAEALSSNDPVVFFESQRLYDVTEQFKDDGVPEAYYRLEMGQPDIKREGKDLTILSIGPCLYTAMDAASSLHQHHALEAEVIDARSLVPFDYDALLQSIKKTGRLIIVSEACERGSYATTIASNLTQFGFKALKAAPEIIGSPNWIVPGAEMESSYFPSAVDIVDRAMACFFPSIEYSQQGVRNWSALELAKKGI